MDAFTFIARTREQGNADKIYYFERVVLALTLSLEESTLKNKQATSGLAPLQPLTSHSSLYLTLIYYLLRQVALLICHK